MEMLLSDKVRVTPAELGCNIQDVLLHKLRTQMEGRCTRHGYIKPDSIQLRRSSMGLVQAFTLNGDAVYRVAYTAQVCNPSIGCVVRAKVVNMNKFGLLAEAVVSGTSTTSVLEIIVARTMVNAKHDVSIDSIRVNDTITVQILGKKYELNERRISVVGRLVDPATTSVRAVREPESDSAADDSDGTSVGVQETEEEDDASSQDEGEEDEEDEDDSSSEVVGSVIVRNKRRDDDVDDFESVADDGDFDGDDESYISDSSDAE